MAGNHFEFLKIVDVSKSFGVVKALSNVSFSVRKGEVHTILGENGAGKSTLVKIIMGELAPDSGSIELNKEKMEKYTPHYARSRGVQMVHQELAIFENLTVAENIFPWNEFISSVGLINWKKLNKEAQRYLDLFDLKEIKPDQMINTVSLAGQQIIEILRCISASPKVLILDEPTSGLNNTDVEKLKSILKRLKKEGHTIIYISHKLKEILEFTDRVTILRDGKYITTIDNDINLTEELLINKMVGRDLSSSLYTMKEYSDLSDSEIIFECKNLYKKSAIFDTSFYLKKGEILGIYGLEGSGTDMLSKSLFGLAKLDKGSFYLKGKQIINLLPHTLVQQKVLYLNNNRKIAGLLLNMPMADNISVAILEEISKYSLIKNEKLNEVATNYVNKLKIAIPSIKTKVKNLSGGNQQKTMLAMCLAAKPDILIINEPTRGIDVGAKAEIHKIIKDISNQGVGILLFTSELPELLSLVDRVLVMREKRVVGELTNEKINEQIVMTLSASENIS